MAMFLGNKLYFRHKKDRLNFFAGDNKEYMAIAIFPKLYQILLGNFEHTSLSQSLSRVQQKLRSQTIHLYSQAIDLTKIKALEGQEHLKDALGNFVYQIRFPRVEAEA
jgi:hypothetical protein